MNDQYGLLNSNLAFSQLIFPNDFYQVIAYGLNDSGQIVGTTEIGKSEYAFVAAPTTVPEPTSWSLGLCGLIAALLLVREGRSFSQLRKSDEPGATIAAVRN